MRGEVEFVCAVAAQDSIVSQLRMMARLLGTRQIYGCLPVDAKARQKIASTNLALMLFVHYLWTIPCLDLDGRMHTMASWALNKT